MTLLFWTIALLMTTLQLCDSQSYQLLPCSIFGSPNADYSIHKLFGGADASADDLIPIGPTNTTGLINTGHSCQVALVFLHSSLLSNEKRMLELIERGINSLNTTANCSLVIFTLGSTRNFEQIVRLYCKESLAIFAKNSGVLSNRNIIANKVEIKVFQIDSLEPGKSNLEAIADFKQYLLTAHEFSSPEKVYAPMKYSNSDVIRKSSNSHDVVPWRDRFPEGIKSFRPKIMPRLRKLLHLYDHEDKSSWMDSLDISDQYHYQGSLECREAIIKVLDQVRLRTNTVITMLQDPKQVSNFTHHIEQQRMDAIKYYKQLTADAVLDGRVHSRVQLLAEEELVHRIYEMLLPFFKRQVQLAKSDITNRFNVAVSVDNLPLSPSIKDELLDIRNEALSELRATIACLTPKNIPATIPWNADFDIFTMQSSLDDYIRLRDTQLRVHGVLPRNRKPISICFHTYLHHVFGKDYRQDVLRTIYSHDELLYDPSVSDHVNNKPHLSAVSLRMALKNKLNVEISRNRFFPVLDSLKHAVLGQPSLQQDAEFAREMLMFPLFIKNPNVPMMGGQRSGQQMGPPTKDPNRFLNGPERLTYCRIYFVIPLCQCV